MDCNKAFASNYMLLKIEEVTFFDLISLLYSSNIGKRKFIDSAQAKEESFQRRLIIFLSVVVQILLKLFSIPMSLIGTLIEFLLNLFNENGNSVFKLLLNLLTGKLKIPNKKSEDYISFVGFLDTRRELDKNIKHGDAKYEAALAMMASKASYENEAYCKNIVHDYWKMEFLGSYNFRNDYHDKARTQALIFRNKTVEDETIVVAFRGTPTFSANAWSTNFDISWYEFKGIGRIHAGFMKALGLQKNTGWPKELDQKNKDNGPFAYYAIREKLRELSAKNSNVKFIVTGHSLGGALAALFPTILVFHEEKDLLERLSGVYTFGQPRLGDENFAKYMTKSYQKHGVHYYRFVYSSDMVPRVPFDDSTLMFTHYGTCVYFNRNYQAKIIEEVPCKNYFSFVGTIEMTVNAIMELIRSLTLQLDQGEEYNETILMLLFRFIGLKLAGIPAHAPMDYVNATRLGYSTSSSPYELQSNDNVSVSNVAARPISNINSYLLL